DAGGSRRLAAPGPLPLVARRRLGDRALRGKGDPAPWRPRRGLPAARRRRLDERADRLGVLRRLRRTTDARSTRHRARARFNSLGARPVGPTHWRLELLLDECEGTDWLFRREPSVRRPLATITWRDAAGISVLQPEIQLLYKAKNARPCD